MKPIFAALQIVFVLSLSFASLVSASEPPLLLANVLKADVDVKRYLVSEKFDGVRAIWDGKTLRFRSGRSVAAPKWFLTKLPTVPLDGELWLARGKFDELSGIVRKTTPVDEEWRRVTYLIFELPEMPGSSANEPFTQRYARMQEIEKAVNWPQLKVVEQFRVADRFALKKRLDAVLKARGEGLMLHLADAPYVTGRSDVLLKLKPLLDAEGEALAHLPGKGKYEGMLGALQVRARDGTVFRLGTGFTDAQRRNPPPLGSIVTYAYRELTPSGKPRFARFVRVRDDP